MDGALQVFRSWTRQDLAPALREMGFRGSGQTFALPHEQCWALLGLQKSTSSGPEVVRFTINLSVTNRRLWEELREWQHWWLGARPSASVQSPGQAMHGIGSVTPTRRDLWWFITAGASTTDLSTLTTDVSTAVVDHGLPALRSMIDANSDEAVAGRIDAIERIKPRPAHLR